MPEDLYLSYRVLVASALAAVNYLNAEFKKKKSGTYRSHAADQLSIAK